MNIRDYRFFGLAIIDFIVTFLIVIILHYYIWNNPIHKHKNRNIIQYIFSLLLLFITFIGIGFLLHWIFSIDSKLSLYLGI